ncbi:hypothetical protein FisN_7Hh235 [Fistulifera solaris]|uniref:Phosphatidylinositol-specific phospholipase C X domain-containing protein n=1 Tax=Fistulifera solaris TaxID=1519565 RepID=A0A1Z5KS59_FISSO|nr:hypothetical protein FisN_7Hh235 [Fistulifera solaris]|eukprot:GAX29164.1 hypothetical protein FisN_7Hh235 [Fistulifera solaris]
MGKGAYVRIQNRSTRSVTMVVEGKARIEDQGMPQLHGTLAAGKQLPAEPAHKVYGGNYTYIEGEAERRVQKDGQLTLVAQHEQGDDKMQLLCDAEKWWARSVAEDEAKPALAISADVGVEEDGNYRIDIKIHDYIPPADWMKVLGNVIADKPLCQVALPGTHDSGTYQFNEELGASPDSDLTSGIQDKLEVGRGLFRKLTEKINDAVLGVVFERLCKCQELTISQQLNEGIRYLDLRIASHGEDQFYTCHGVYCVNIDTVLDEVAKFLGNHPKEIVLLDFNHLYEMTPEHHKLLAARITQKLGPKMASQKEGLSPDSPVREYWEKNAQAVVIYHDEATHNASNGKLWFKNCIDSKWPEANDTETLRSKLENTVEARPKNKFFVLQGILTPDTDLIKKEIFEGRGDLSIRNIAKRATPKVSNWVEDDWDGKTQNIVMVDFFNDCSMVTPVINMNKK